MAKGTLSDRDRTVNNLPPFVTPQITIPARNEPTSQVEKSLIKAKSLVSVAQCQGFSNCPAILRHHYLMVIDELLEEALRGLSRIGNVQVK